MNKKIDLWVLLLIVWLGLVFTIVFSWSVRSQLVGSHRAGFFGELAEKVAALPANAYSLFKERTSDPPLIIKNRWPEIDHFKKNGVLYSGVLKDDGYLLLPAYNNGKGQSTVQLIRIKDQKLLHEWTPDLSEIKRVHKNSDLSNFPINFDVSTPFKASRFRSLHPLLLDDGGILYGSGLFLIKSTVCDSIVVVVKQYKHHSAEMAPDGSVWVPTTIYPTSYDTIISEYRDDAITNVSMDGKILFVKSVSQILEENGYRSLLFGVGTIETDPIHLNDIQPAFYSSKYWKKDDLLISIRNKSTIFLYRPKINKIIWLKTGPWLHQHDVDFIGN
ncbi:MAG: hypothetical protein HQ541_01500, partial [Mariniphaga sp.]|nr:hypothetical protein [Mariniphaga sp.]